MEIKWLTTSIAASALMLSPALAQQDTQDTQRMAPPPSAGLERQIDADLQMQGDFIVAQTPGHWLGSNILGANAVTSDGEVVGNVEDFLLDEHHRVVGLIIGVGGFLGIGERDVAIPLHAAAIVPGRQAEDGTVLEGGLFTDPVGDVVIEMTADEIEAAPEFVALEEAPAVNGTPPASPNQTPAREPQVD
jgi:hypothetical protein